MIERLGYADIALDCPASTNRRICPRERHAPGAIGGVAWWVVKAPFTTEARSYEREDTENSYVLGVEALAGR